MGNVSTLAPKGYVTITNLDGKLIEQDTLQCVHCGSHWAVMPGSGRQRGWCMTCGGPHCGGKFCWTCIPLEKKMDIIEGTRNSGAIIVGGF